MDRADAAGLDGDDPLASFRNAFVIADDDLVYLDGNSLGRLPVATLDRIHETVADQWGVGLVRSWHDWIALPQQVGDELAPIIGAAPGEVLISDQTSLNLFKLASAAVTVERPDIVTDSTNFPSDIYVLDSVARAAGGRLIVVDCDDVEGPSIDRIEQHLSESVGVVALSHVAFKSAAIADMATITAAAHRAGALALWDLSHSAGAVPVALDDCEADLAVGCTYKHLNGGPGAPAFLYVAERLQRTLRQPIAGWWGHATMFEFTLDYRPAADLRRFAVGTPSIVALRAAAVGIGLTAKAGVEAIRAKNTSLTSLLVERYDARLARIGFTLGSPRDAAARGSHVSLRHGEASRITQALIERSIVPDFRAPDNIRIGVAGLYTTHVEVWDAVEALAQIVERREYERFAADISGVT
ncbi:MAG TPA: kynureninase [Acidimicrobiia bacterium]